MDTRDRILAICKKHDLMPAATVELSEETIAIIREELNGRMLNLEMAVFGKTGNNWHSTGELPSGVKTGTIGASTHITDSDGFPMSKGFHSIEEEIPQMTFVGKTGATVTRFGLDVCELIHSRKGRPSPPEPELIQGYTAEQWQEIIDGEYLCEFANRPELPWWLGRLEETPIEKGSICMASCDEKIQHYAHCRPAQIKGVMRPIFVEPVNESIYCSFFKDARSVTRGQWKSRVSFAKADGANKYIEL